MSQEEHHELALIVVGENKSGKTSVCNSLLGHTDTQQCQRTVKCVKYVGHLSGKRLTVVDTPGWWKDILLIDTAARTKHELQLSVRLCPPGPHAFILTVEIDNFTEKSRRAVKEHIGLFGERIWRHTIVVFTKRESLKGKSMEQHFESEGGALKWLVEKCENRYCVYEKQTKDQSQIINMLQMIERLKVSNSGRHFELDEDMLMEVERKKSAAEEKAQARLKKVQERSKQLQDKGQIQFLSEVRIVILGWVICGKTSAKNVILGKHNSAPQSKTERCEEKTGMVGNRSVTVVDTPGWWKYFPTQYTPEWVKMELEQSVSLGSMAPHALLLVVPADVSFLEEQRKITEKNMKMFGEMAWRHTLILFTWGDSLGNTSIEEHIESEGEPLRWLVEKCGNRYHVFDNINRGNSTQVHQLLQKIDEMEASVRSGGPTHKAPEASETTESYRQAEEFRPDMMEFLEKGWNRRDNELEEKIRAMWQEAFGSAIRGDRSMNQYIVFNENEHSVEKVTPVNSHQTEFSAKDSSSESYQQRHGPETHWQSAEEKKKVTFEREYGRCKAIIMERVHRILFPELYRSCMSPGQADHEPQEQAYDRNMQEFFTREWFRHEAIVMEKARDIITEIFSQSEVVCSELGEHEIEQSRTKVLNWPTATSGFGSALEEDIHFTSDI